MNNNIKNNLEHTLFSWTKQGGLNPIEVDRASGCYVYDKEGKAYLDFSSQLMNVNIGHGNQRVTKAVEEQMKRFSFVYPGMATDPRGELGELLSEITPPKLNKSFFTLGGAEAIENSIKLARNYTGRHKIISHYRSYHGATYAAMAVSGDPRKFAIDVQAPGNFVHVENPYFYRCPWGSNSEQECAEMALAHLERVVNFENPNAVAAILFEGESGSSGCIKYPAGYLARVREICDKYGILLIIDEVMSGFGRTGKMFGVDHHGISPDIMCMAKGLTSGYLPLGAIAVTDEIADTYNDKALPLGLTYSAHSVCCAAALENIRIIQGENLVERAAEMGQYLEGRMQDMIASHPSIGDFRNTGLLGCVELVKNRETKEPLTPWNAKPNQMANTIELASKIRELGMFTFVRWNWIFIAPPLIITKEEMEEGLHILSQVISLADKHCN